jgi:phage minor structural protein
MLSIYDYQNNRLADLRFLDERIEGEAYNIILKENIYDLSTLEFSVPFYTMIDGVQEVNWRIDFLLNEYKVRLIWQDYDEYFYIKNVEEEHDDNGLRYIVQCTHVAEILNKRGVQTSIDTTGNATTLLDAVLNGSGWTSGIVSTFEKDGVEKIRNYKKDTSSCMEMLTDIAEIFDGFLKFHSTTKKVDLLKEYGENNGVVFRYEKNIININRQYNTSDICTRLWVVGGSVDDEIVTIADINDNKQPFKDNFSYFEALMSSTQQTAITTYNSSITTINNNINTTLSNISTTENNISTTQNSIDIKTILKATKVQLKAEVDAKILIEKDSTTLVQLQAQSSQLAGEISTLNSEISSMQSQLTTYNNNLSTYNSNLTTYRGQKTSAENTFKTVLDEFIREGVYNNSNYVDAQSLYDDAVDTLNKVCLPKVEYSMSILDLSVLTGYELEKFNLGDIIGIVDEPLLLGIDSPVLAKITEIVRYIDDSRKNSIQIANFRGAFSDMWKRIARSAEIIKQRQEFYERSYLGLTDQGLPKGDILQECFDSNKFTITNGSNNDVQFGKFGIVLTDNDNTDRQIKEIGKGIFLTKDGGNTYPLGITADGISALLLTSGVVDTKVIQIWNTEQPKFFWRDTGLFAYGDTDSKFIRFNYTGLYGTSKSGVSPTSTTESDFNLILNWDKLQITNSSNTTRMVSGVTDGFKLQKSSDGGGNWTNTFSADTNGNLTLTGVVKATDFQSPNGTSLFVSGTSGTNSPIIKGSVIEANTVIAGSVKADWVYAGNVSANQITAGTISATISITAPTITGGNFSGVTITGSTIQTASSGARVVLGTDNTIKCYNSSNQLHGLYVAPGSFTDLFLYKNGNEIFRVYDDAPALGIYMLGGRILYRLSSITYPDGIWDFSDCTVQNLNTTARFA